MKLLMLTQKVDKDDPEFFFLYRWIEEFAKHFSLVTVICLEKGASHLPENVRVLSLGKEEGKSRLKYIFCFYKYIWNERKNYDVVFVHMNPEYVVLGGLLWKCWGKKVALWYTHRQVNLKLRLATMLADVIFTASPEGFGLTTSKLNILGHGIDASAFLLPPVNLNQPLVVGYVGRITKIKHLEIILKAARTLSVETVVFTGAPVTPDDHRYKKYLQALARELALDTKVKWPGIRPSQSAYQESSLTVNAVPTGGMDKAVLESLASGRPVFTSNNAFRNIFGAYASTFIFDFNNPDDLAVKIKTFLALPERERLVAQLSKTVRDEYDVKGLIARMTTLLQ